MLILGKVLQMLRAIQGPLIMVLPIHPLVAGHHTVPPSPTADNTPGGRDGDPGGQKERGEGGERG